MTIFTPEDAVVEDSIEGLVGVAGFPALSSKSITTGTEPMDASGCFLTSTREGIFGGVAGGDGGGFSAVSLPFKGGDFDDMPVQAAKMKQ